MSDTPAPSFCLRGEYTFSRPTKVALCLRASWPKRCFYETWLGQVKLGHLVLVVLTHTHTHTCTHAHTHIKPMLFFFSQIFEDEKTDCKEKKGWGFPAVLLACFLLTSIKPHVLEPHHCLWCSVATLLFSCKQRKVKKTTFWIACFKLLLGALSGFSYPGCKCYWTLWVFPTQFGLRL